MTFELAVVIASLTAIVFALVALAWRLVSAIDGLAQVLAKLGVPNSGASASLAPLKSPLPVLSPPAAGQPTVMHDPSSPGATQKSPNVSSALEASTPGAMPDFITPGFIDFVRTGEGFAPVAKWDYKQYTNGYGTRALSSTEAITREEAERRLLVEINASAALVEKFCPSAPKGVKQAVCDLTFNSGAGWEHLGLGTEIKAGNYEAAKAHLIQYNHAGGVVLEDLTKRRAAEVSWFDTPL